MALQHKRILLKLSGEALAGTQGFGLDTATVRSICAGVAKAHAVGAQLAIVVGGGNFWRGRSGGDMERTRSDQIGMLGTVMNALAVADALEKQDVLVRVQTAITMTAIAEPYIRNRAVRHMEKGRVVVLACGTGNPFFSTDTASALRAAELGADIIFKATLVDGVYSADPKIHTDARRYHTLNWSDVIARGLKVMDSTAATMCQDNNLPVLVFNLADPGNIVRAATGERVGTYISTDAETVFVP